MQNQTQTKQFMQWFGDWRVNDQTTVQVATKEGSTRGLQHNADTGWDISISGKVFNETKSHNMKSNTSARPYLEYINDIVNKAILLDTYTIGKPKSPNSLLMHTFYAVADIGDAPQVLKLYVEEMYAPGQSQTGKRAYQLQNIENQQLSVKGSSDNVTLASSFSTADIYTVADLFQAVKQRDKKFSPKAASQIVNEDGSPKIMYHQTDADFSVFRTESTGAGQCCSITVNVYGNLRIENGTPVVVGIVMKLDRSGSNLISNIRTIHARSDFAKQITDDSVLYLNEDKKRTRTWFHVCDNLKVPLDGTMFGFIRSITYQDTKSNRYSVKSRSAESYESEIERLKKQRDEAKRQIKLSKYQQVSPAGIKRMAQDLLAEYRSTANAEELIDTLNKSDSFLNQTCFFNLRYTVRYMVEKLAAPPSRLEIGSARKTPLTPSPAKCGRRSVSGMTTMPFRKMEKKMA